MVTFNRDYRDYRVVSVYDETDQDEQEASESTEPALFDLRDVVFWSGLSLAIGIFIGMAIVSGWKGLP